MIEEDQQCRDYKNWKCMECGAVCNPLASEWRWAGVYWEHYHGYPIGHVMAHYCANDPATEGVDCTVVGIDAYDEDSKTYCLSLIIAKENVEKLNIKAGDTLKLITEKQQKGKYESKINKVNIS